MSEIRGMVKPELQAILRTRGGDPIFLPYLWAKTTYSPHARG